MATPDERYRQKRILTLVVAALCVETVLYLIAKRGPALAGLIRPAYAVVLVLFALPVWHASRLRTGHDRRDADRRHGSPNE